MNDESNNYIRPVVDDNDREAARRALARNWPHVGHTHPKYAALLEPLADFHRLFGADSFELRYRLRPPKDRTEQWEQQYMHGEITQTELRDRLKADAERPIDAEMLTSFCDCFQDRLAHYSGVLQNAVLLPSEECSSTCRAKEKAIDKHISVLRSKFPLWRENLETVFEFLEELRITSGAGLLKLGEFEGTSSHWLAELIFTRMTEAWRSCQEISERSRRDRRYLYATTAIDLFRQQWLPTFPMPQSLGERLREEFILARAALKRTCLAAYANSDTTSDAFADTTDVEQSIDNESRELILIGKVFSIVGQAGHIFRPIPNSDWGIDGEIEFKDSEGRASGKRVYVQLKSGDSYLTRRSGSGEEVFTVKKLRHLDYWVQHEYPVLLVIRQSSGLIRWMDVSAYLKQNPQRNRQIIFRGEPFSLHSIRGLAEKSLKQQASLGG